MIQKAVFKVNVMKLNFRMIYVMNILTMSDE